MENKGLTKKQFWVRMLPHLFNYILGIFWIIYGVRSDIVIYWIIGACFIIFATCIFVSLVLERKRHPIEDAELDKEADESIKSGLLGLGFLAGVVLLVVGMIALFTHLAR